MSVRGPLRQSVIKAVWAYTHILYKKKKSHTPLLTRTASYISPLSALLVVQSGHDINIGQRHFNLALLHCSWQLAWTHVEALALDLWHASLHQTSAVKQASCRTAHMRHPSLQDHQSGKSRYTGSAARSTRQLQTGLHNFIWRLDRSFWCTAGCILL